jgi:hypothetical protein
MTPAWTVLTLNFNEQLSPLSFITFMWPKIKEIWVAFIKFYRYCLRERTHSGGRWNLSWGILTSKSNGARTLFWWSWPPGGDHFGIGCHFHCQTLAASCSANEVATWVAMPLWTRKTEGLPHPALCLKSSANIPGWRIWTPRLNC